MAIEQAPKQTRINQQQADRISELPDDILLHILSRRLTLKEACITSSLSRRWRHLFPSLPRLEFDHFSFCSSPACSHTSWSWFHAIDIDVWLRSIWAILEPRRAAVRICTIVSDYFEDYSEDFCNIIRFLCNNGIQKLTVLNMGGPYSFPPCLYFCRTATRVVLNRCFLKVPSEFSGLRRLVALRIEECIVEDGDLQRLILGCPAIERLAVHNCYVLRTIAVDAPKLAALDVSTHRPIAVSIGKAPLLESVTVRFGYDLSDGYQAFPEEDPDDGELRSEASRLVRLLESLGNIQNLSLDIEFENRHMEMLRAGGAAVPATLRSPLPEMRRLTLRMQLNNTFMASIVSCLLNSCPRLEDLVVGVSTNLLISPEDSVLGYWDQKTPSHCMRTALSSVVVYLDDGHSWRYWIKLVKFLLNNACVLKKMVIDCYHGEMEQSMLGDLQRELLLLRRASPDAVVEIKTDRRREFDLE